ncbi:fatty acid desaturase family protein [Aquipuribacter sp. MA13-6]|uniref:fatty acid desaturase family protein n=1 Tax=unclassified Aquipuribacter TaxID=2635084 RepID=UPI003EEB8280
MATSTRLSTVTTERTLTPKRSGKPDPTAHLDAEQVEALGRELDALRKEVFDSRDSHDAAYIRRVIKVQRSLELSSRAVLLFSLFPPAWFVGTAGLSVAKILENMEIGHNIMHGQWDWMRDPKIHSTAYEWDHASPSELWKHSHNELHHTFTNVLGRDNDLGYGIMRVDEEQRWYPAYVLQPFWNFLNACFFEYGIASYDLELGKKIREGGLDDPEFKADVRKVLTKIRRQMTKDYLVHPALSGPSFLHTLGANMVANLVRNVWTHSVIMCGHFPEGVETFAKESIEGETRGEWYLRQMMGSANIRGSKAMHVMTGNLSHQIEHHLFPDMPSNRYAQIAPRIQDICSRYGISYTTGTLPQQVASAWRQVIKLSLPDDTSAAQTAAMLARGAATGVRRRVGALLRSRKGSPAGPSVTAVVRERLPAAA